MSAPILQIRVPGRPRPKGSMRHVGNGRLVEQLAGSPDWRSAVRTAAYEAYQQYYAHSRVPYSRAVKVDIVLELPRPAKPKDPRYPSGGNTGDVDKHARNILDALQDAGVIKNDAQVVDLAISKRWTTFAPGAHITVWPAASIPETPRPGPAATHSPGPGGAGDRTLPTPDAAHA